jgi:hypothetical protein
MSLRRWQKLTAARTRKRVFFSFVARRSGLVTVWVLTTCSEGGVFLW